jgi:hypothetical protein
MKYSVTTPEGVMRPIRLPSNSVNQRLPSEPAAMLKARVVVASGNSVTTPAVVMRPILLPGFSVNQRFPAAPAVIALL